ncbi:hypothetical protein Y1Q_0015396 [Alligator mississippiensis]|uniref:MHC class II beta chain N-terminal domain-containing protein n=1 Tax=Alligator mississippiensis TaxID=8496 RepID=A0A151PDW8_ALLMI|nr:hypothetical protein Y1Q_0015396 [Alligator mississippiensis]
MIMSKADCVYTNGTQQLKCLYSCIWDRQQDVHFDSNVGMHVADTVWAEPDAKHWNSQKEEPQHAWSEMDSFCRHNYGVYENFINTHKGEFCRYDYGLAEQSHVIGRSGESPESGAIVQ